MAVKESLKSTLILVAFLIITHLSSTSVYALNERPVSTGLFVDVEEDLLILTEGTTTDVPISVTVIDVDGCTDVDNVIIKFFRTDLGFSCEEDESNCYEIEAVQDAGSCLGDRDISSTWFATIPVQYYADASEGGIYDDLDWTADAIPSDFEGSGTSAGDYTLEVATLTAISIVPGSIDFGSMDLGESTGTSDLTTTFTNTGNQNIGLNVRGEDSSGAFMICDFGYIAAERLVYELVSDVSYEEREQLSSEDIYLGFVLTKGSGEEATRNIYWGFGVPDSGVGGSCTGTVVFTPTDPV